VFEEAFGEDALLPDLLGTSETWLAMDLAEVTVREGRLRERRPAARFLAADARKLPLRNASLDLVLSTSKLDHFDSRREFVAAIAEIARVLRPGGRLLLTIDNPSNSLYRPLRWLGKNAVGSLPVRLFAVPIQSSRVARGGRARSHCLRYTDPQPADRLDGAVSRATPIVA
jgi:ubiquinone/menaquinone biosynthesis C-methylase UbiE